MTITHADFFRILPKALGSNNYSVENNRIKYARAGFVMEILLSEERYWEIGALQLPAIDLEITLQGCTAAKALVFMKNFDLSFQKGGG